MALSPYHYTAGRTHAVSRSTRPFCSWILDLRAERLKPRLVLLEDVGHPHLDGSRERHWIAAWRAAGALLLNRFAPGWRSAV